jgi:phosphonate transport system substrate-binding protein
MPEMRDLVLGAVAYDAKVVPIWEGFKAYLAARGLPFDFVLYASYERQVAAHLRGDIDVAWNSPLAWVHTRRAAPDRARAIAMRDTDRDLTSVVLVRADPAAPPIGSVADLRRVATGAADSPQATLIPLLALADAGARVEAVHHDLLLGKHGDHIGGERDAVEALLAGEVDAACVIDGNRLAFAREGLFAPGQLRVVLQTGPYDHCNVTALADTPEIDRLRELLLAMSYDDPVVRPLLDMEGLRQWLPGRTSGYALLERTVGQ